MYQQRKLLFYKDYFYEFFNPLPNKVQEKIDYVLFVITIADRIPKKFFEHLTGTDGLYEIRIESPRAHSPLLAAESASIKKLP